MDQLDGAPKISKYAYGKDYHHVIKDKLKQLFQIINNKIGEVSGRVFVDSAPVMEKSWAVRSGLGWQGKNTNLISKKAGSFFFIAELIVDLELEYDTPVTDHCGSCTACIDACPTEALTPYNIDASKCISYLTIELKDQIPTAFKNKMDDWAFGCDVCQEVCPWNRKAPRTADSTWKARNGLKDRKLWDWVRLSQEDFSNQFQQMNLI